ncbi:MAG: hypothetical protein KIG97_10340, partial [Fibrobacter sp.]|uniref:hypothetical protein n=1 Tax=Fibrobacter sp. TaxID=35828 RepID=UPI0025C0A250
MLWLGGPGESRGRLCFWGIEVRITKGICFFCKICPFFGEKWVYLWCPVRVAGLPLDIITNNIRVSLPKFAQKRQFR